jgi:hypothetical protein
MAKCIGPLHSSEARGRMGGLVYNTWRGLNVVKATTAPCQPRSQKQLAVRATGVAVGRAWGAKTEASRADWNSYAAVHLETDGMGSPKRLSGMNWWLRLAARMTFFGLVPAAGPPAGAAPASPLLFSAANGAGSSVVTWTSPGGTATLMEIYMQGPHSAGRAGKLANARYRVHLAAEGATVTITPLSAGVYSFWGRYATEADGQVSPWVTDDATVT